MKKIIQRTKRFDKSFLRLPIRIREKFVERLEIFLDNENSSILRVHKLNGKLDNYYAFSVTGDVRAIYKKDVTDGKTIIVFTFMNIGGHNKVY